MPTPRRSVLTGQLELSAQSESPPAAPARPGISPRGPLWLLVGAVVLLLSAFGLLAVWRVQPGVLPFVPRTATLIPTANVTQTSLPAQTATSLPIPNPGGKDVTRELQSIEMLAGGYGWGLGRHSLWRTNDGGQTWFDVTPPLAAASPTLEHVFFHSRLSAWFLLPQAEALAALYATHDGGQSWQSSAVPFGAAELHFADPAHGWAWGLQSGEPAFFLSADGGQSWGILAGNGLPPTASGPAKNARLSFSDTRRGWLALPGQSAGLYASEDGGSSWEARDLLLPTSLDWAVWSPLDAPLFFDDNFGPGILPARAVERSSRSEVQVFFLTNDGGRTWQAGQPVTASVSYSFPSARSLFVVDVRGALLRSLDGGQTWQAGGSFSDRLGSGITIRPLGIDFISDEQGWAWQVIDGQFYLFDTIDGGDTWRQLDYTTQAKRAEAQALARQAQQDLLSPGSTLPASTLPASTLPASTLRAANTLLAACRWQAADSNLPVLPISQAGPYQGWNLYLNPDHHFSMKIPPGWTLAEVSYACPGLPGAVHRLVLHQDGALFTLGFRRPGQAIPLRHPGARPPEGLLEQGAAAILGTQAPRAVLAAAATADAPRAIYYNHGQEIEVGSEYIFTAMVQADRPGQPDAALDSATVQQVEQMLASLEPLRADATVLSRMDVRSTMITSPDGDWEVEALAASPLALSQIGYNYRRVVVASRASSRRWTALDAWERIVDSDISTIGFGWSRDGRWLYLYDISTPNICPLFDDHAGLRRLDLASGQLEYMNLSASTMANLVVSPDGERVAFLPSDYQLNPRIMVHSLVDESENSADQQIAFDAPQIEGWGAGRLLWSPDGSRLVFALAGPYCSNQLEQQRLVVLADPVSGQTRPLTGLDEWLSIDQWLPDGRLRLVNRFNSLFALNIDSGELEPLPPDRLAEAEETLQGFFMMLHNTWFDPGTYAWVAEHYGGSYAELRRLNPTVDPRDGAALFQRACEQNGYYCLRLRRVTARELISQDGPASLFRFTVEFLLADGSLFSLRGRTSFDFTVSLRPDGAYRIMNLPPK